MNKYFKNENIKMFLVEKKEKSRLMNKRIINQIKKILNFKVFKNILRCNT